MGLSRTVVRRAFTGVRRLNRFKHIRKFYTEFPMQPLQHTATNPFGKIALFDFSQGCNTYPQFFCHLFL